jgi:hypothetical protein
MIDFDVAQEIAEKYLGRQERISKIQLQITDRIDVDEGWVLFYNSKKYAISRDFRDMLAGNAPLFIDSNSGELYELGTAEPLECYLNKCKKGELKSIDKDSFM